MNDYMEAVEEDRQQEDLENLISIVDYNRDALWDNSGYVGGDGSERWNLGNFENMEDEQQKRNQMIADSRKINWIWSVIKRELSSKYVLVCGNCGKNYFNIRRPRYPANEYICSECNTEGSLQLLSFEEWASPEIMKIKNSYNF